MKPQGATGRSGLHRGGVNSNGAGLRTLRGAVLAAICTGPLSLGACQQAPSDQDTLEQANLAKALYCMHTLEVELDLDAFARKCVAEDHIEHSPHVPNGKQGLIDYMAGRIERFPEMHLDIKRSAADGDLVWIHGHFKSTPDAIGNAVVQVSRMEDVKFAEPWGVSREVQETISGNSMF